MTEKSSRSTGVTCVRCGETSTGRFCSECGAPLRELSCSACGVAAPPGSRFCAECGASFGFGGASANAANGGRDGYARLIGGAAVCALFGFAAGNFVGRRSTGDTASAETPTAAPLAGAPGSAPDISAMSPEERASRLFNRVMAYSEQGKMDSARFFAPMAIQSYEMLGPVDAHTRYDIGEISAAVGDVSRAKAEADTILAQRPNHLLGLVLEIRAAELAKDQAAESKFKARLVSAAKAERATGLKEYDEHSRDIDEALKKARVSPE